MDASVPMVLRDFDDVRAAVGRDVGPSPWYAITQSAVDDFAAVTGDAQWIHVDVVRATRGPYGGTIAHGYLTLSLLPALSARLIAFDMPGARVNYGLDRVRFPRPVRVGRSVRLRTSLRKVDERGPRGLLATFAHIIEVEGESVPACVADGLVLFTVDKR